MELETIAFVWDGSAMIPLDRFRGLARRQYRPGTEYALSVWRGRSDISHRHYFACLKQAWLNLPEEWAQEFPSPEYLRKWCLIREGYATHRQFACATPDDVRNAIDMIRDIDPYASIRVRDRVIDAWFAASQDHASMNHEKFQESKDRVFGRVAGMLGITVAELAKNAKETA